MINTVRIKTALGRFARLHLKKKTQEGALNYDGVYHSFFGRNGVFALCFYNINGGQAQENL